MNSTLVDSLLENSKANYLQQSYYDVTTSADTLNITHMSDRTSDLMFTTSAPSDSTSLCRDNLTSSNCSHGDELLMTSSVYKRHEILVMSLYIIIEVIGLTLNITVSRVITKSRLFRDSANLVLLNLSFVDCLHCTVLTIPIVSIATGSWTSDDQACAAFGFLLHCLACVSLNNIAAIAIQRYLSVVKNHQWRTTRRQWKWVIIGVWVIGLLESLPLLAAKSNLPSHPDPLTCSLHWPWSAGSHISYIILYSVFGVALPIVIQISCYCKIYARVSSVARRVRYSRMSGTVLASHVSQLAHSSPSVGPSASSTKASKLPPCSDPGPRRTYGVESGSGSGSPGFQNDDTLKRSLSKTFRKNRHEERLARTVVLTSLGTYLSWGPYFVTIFVSAARPISQDVAAVTAILASLSTICNPIFYVLLNKGFRNSLILPFNTAEMSIGSHQSIARVGSQQHGSVSTISCPENRTSQFNTTWRSSLQTQQNENTGAAPDGLATITELSSPVPSSVFGSNANTLQSGIIPNKIDETACRQVTTSTQTRRRKRKMTSQMLSAKSFTVPVVEPLPDVE